MDKREAIAKIESKLGDIIKCNIDQRRHDDLIDEALFSDKHYLRKDSSVRKLEDSQKKHKTKNIKVIAVIINQIVKIMKENNIKLIDLSKSGRSELITASGYTAIPLK